MIAFLAEQYGYPDGTKKVRVESRCLVDGKKENLAGMERAILTAGSEIRTVNGFEKMTPVKKIKSDSLWKEEIATKRIRQVEQ